MNALDVLFLVIALASIAIGVWRGFAREVFSLAALVIGLICAHTFAPVLTELIFEWFNLFGLWVLVTSFLVILFLIIAVGRMVSYLTRSFFRGMGLQTWETVGGGFFGLLRAWLIVMIFALVMDNTPSRQQDWVRGSQSMRWAFEFNEYLGLGLEDKDWVRLLEQRGGRVIEPLLKNMRSKAISSASPALKKKFKEELDKVKEDLEQLDKVKVDSSELDKVKQDLKKHEKLLESIR